MICRKILCAFLFTGTLSLVCSSEEKPKRKTIEAFSKKEPDILEHVRSHLVEEVEKMTYTRLEIENTTARSFALYLHTQLSPCCPDHADLCRSCVEGNLAANRSTIFSAPSAWDVLEVAEMSFARKDITGNLRLSERVTDGRSQYSLFNEGSDKPLAFLSTPSISFTVHSISPRIKAMLDAARAAADQSSQTIKPEL